MLLRRATGVHLAIPARRLRRRCLSSADHYAVLEPVRIHPVSIHVQPRYQQHAVKSMQLQGPRSGLRGFSSLDTQQKAESESVEAIETDTSIGFGSSNEDRAIAATINTSDESRAEKLKDETKRLLRLLDPASSNDADVADQISKVDLTEIERVMEGWSSLHEVSTKDGVLAAESAESLLQSLEDNYDRYSASALDNTTDEGISWRLTPNVACYNFVLHAYAISRGGWNAAVAAQAILERMIQRCNKYATDMQNTSNASIDPPPPPPPEPSDRSFNCVINAWSKCRDIESGNRAEEIFRMMEEWDYDCQQHEGNKTPVGKYYNGVKPSVRSFSGAIDAWANSGAGVSSTDRVMAILDKMIEKRKEALVKALESDDSEEIAFCKPNVIVFNAAINAFAKSGRGIAGAEQAEEIIDKMVALDESGELGQDGDHDDENNLGLKPNTRSFSTVLDAFSRCAADEIKGVDAVSRSEALLERMEELYTVGGYAVKPNHVCFTEVITALARCKGLDDAAERAEALLDKLIELYQASDDDEEMKPTSKTFNSLITAYARSKHPDSVDRAQAVFDKLCNFSVPDAASYASLIDAHAKSRKSDAGEKALTLLNRMEQDSSVEADLYPYNSTINALAQSFGSPTAANDAVSLLERMEKGYDEGNENLKPDRFSYTSTLQALAKSSSGPDAGIKARQILDRLIERSKDSPDSQPDLFAYTTCVNACASVHIDRNTDMNEKRQCLITAIRTFEDLKKEGGGGPNNYAYGAIIKACSRLGADRNERDRLCRALFKECCQAGQLSKMVLMWFKRGSSRELKMEVFGELEENYGPEGGEIIPQDWTRKVRNWKDRPDYTSDHKDGRRAPPHRRKHQQQ